MDSGFAERLEQCSPDPSAAVYCSFDAASVEPYSGELEVVSDVVKNCFPTENVSEKWWQDTRSQELGVKVAGTAGVTIAGIINVSLTTEFHTTWTESKTMTDKQSMRVPSMAVGWMERGPDMMKVTGTWFFVSGDRMWVNEGVSHTAPAAAGNGELYLKWRPMTESERAQCERDPNQSAGDYDHAAALEAAAAGIPIHTVTLG
jgi:hypothetical protein